MLRRVRKEEVIKTNSQGVDPLEVCLDYWRIWMSFDDRDLDAKTSNICQPDRDGYTDQEYDPELAERQQINYYGGAVHACINSLTRLHATAIYRRCGISSVWSFPSANLFEVIPMAEKMLIEKLKKNVATSDFF